MTDHQSIVEELKAYYRALEGEEMQEGDLTIPQLTAEMGGSQDHWRRLLKLGKIPPGYQVVEVRNPYNAGRMRVLRRIEPI